jgi:hypothetical protein
MLKAASTEIVTPNLITTAITSNHFNHSHLSLSLSFSYIDIIQAHLEHAREIPRFFCKENLTQKYQQFASFGTIIAREYKP